MSFGSVALLTLLMLLAIAVEGGSKAADARQACDLIKNVNLGQPLRYICPKDVAKECMMNVNGWCAKPKKEHKSCLSCSDSASKMERQIRQWEEEEVVKRAVEAEFVDIDDGEEDGIID